MSVRLFVAADLPEGIREALPEPGEPWRPVARESLHVTLAFLGWMDEEDVPSVRVAVSRTVRAVGELEVDSVVLLPPRKPRVMAVRLIDGDPPLAALQAGVVEALARTIGFVGEERPFLPHVTIGRGRGRDPVPRDAPLPEVERLRFRPPTIAVYSSQLRAGGSTYEAIERFDLP